jgi:hypothetical protein
MEATAISPGPSGAPTITPAGRSTRFMAFQFLASMAAAPVLYGLSRFAAEAGFAGWHVIDITSRFFPAALLLRETSDLSNNPPCSDGWPRA